VRDCANRRAALNSLKVEPATLQQRRHAMPWTTPTLVEICIGLEINGYLPAEF
jgi:coenzyme PQQ precursor peptide PqqA